MNIYFVRHGVTDWNIEGRYQGWSDSDLTTEGLAQAWKTADYFAVYSRCEGVAFDALYCSPLRRARRTAGAIADRLYLPPQLWPDLSEMNGGVVEGLTQEQWQALYPALIPAWSDPENLEFRWPGGETRRQFMNRVRQAMDAIIAQHSETDNVIVVAHGGVIMSYLEQVVPYDPQGPRPYNILNCGVTHVQLNHNDVAETTASIGCLLRLSDVQHLETSIAEAI